LKLESGKKKDRLLTVINKLLPSTPGRQRIDLSYLLHGPTGKRQTRKPAYLQQFLDTSKHRHDSDSTLPSTTWSMLLLTLAVAQS